MAALVIVTKNFRRCKKSFLEKEVDSTLGRDTMGAVLNRDVTKMSKEIQNLLDEIKKGLVLIKTSGNSPIEYYGIKGADIELIERLADERDAHDQYQRDVAYRFNTKFKTAQTTQDGSKRVDTLGKGDKLKAAKALVDAMFTAKESAATKQKKAITSGADLVSQIDEAKAKGNDELASELQEQLNDMMRAFVTK